MAKTKLTPTLIPKSPAGTMKTFMEPSNTSLASYNLQGDALAAAETKLRDNMMLDDVITGMPEELSLTTMLTGDDAGTAPEDRVHMTVDTRKLASAVEHDKNLGYDDRKTYLRAVQIIDDIQKNNLTITKSPTGRYWLESNEDGTRHFAKQGILEVAELLDNYTGASVAGDKVVYPDIPGSGNEEEEQIVDKDKEPVFDPFAPDVIAGVKDSQARQAEIVRRGEVRDDVVANMDPYKMAEHDRWKLWALGTDIFSSIGGTALKVTGAGALVGAGLNIVGGLGAAAMEGYGDWLDPDVTASQMWKGIGLRLGAETVETFTGVPASVGFGVKKAIPIIKNFIFRAGAIDTAITSDWNETLDKELEDWNIADYRKMAFIVQTVLAGPGANAAGRYKAKKDLRKANTSSADSDVNIKKVSDKRDATTAEHKDAQSTVAKSKELSDINTKKKQGIEDANANTTAQKKKVDDSALNPADTKKITDKRPADYTPKKPIDAPAVTPTKPLIKRKAFRTNDTPKLRNKKKLAAKKNDNIKKQNADIEAKNKLRKKEVEDKNKAIKKQNEAKEKRSAREKEVTDQKISAKKKVVDKKTKEKLDDANAANVKNVEKAAGKEKKKLIAKTTTDAKLRGEKKTRDAETARVEKEVDDTFGGASTRMKRKAKEDAYGEARSKRMTERQEAISKQAKDAKSKLGKAKKKADIMEAQIAKNRGKDTFDTDAKTKELNKQKKKVERLQKVSDNYFIKKSKAFKKGRKKLQARVGNTVRRGYNTVAGTNYQGVGDRAQRASLLAGDTREAILGDKDYDYDTKEATDRLIKNLGFTKEELKGLSSKQLSELVKREEGRIKKTKSGRYPAKVKTNRLREAKGRDTRKDIKRADGGKLRLIARTGSVRKAQGGIKTEKVVAPVFKNAVTQGVFNNWKQKVGFDDMVNEEDKLAALAEFKKLYGKHNDLSLVPNREGFGLLEFMQPSDFMKMSKARIDTFALRNVIAPTTYADPVSNMPGFKLAMHELNKPVPKASADSYKVTQMGLKNFNEAAKNKAKLIVKNAEFVDRKKTAKLAARNTNDAAQVQAYNQNKVTQNAAEERFLAQENAAEAKAATENNARKARRTNGLWKGVDSVFTGRKKETYAREYNKLAGLRNIWMTEYAPRIDKIHADGVDVETKIGTVKNEFIANNGGMNPDFIVEDMKNLSTSYDNI